MNIEKLADGVKVFVRNQIYGKQSDFEIYPTYLQTTGERKNINDRKKVVSFMLNTYPKDFVDEITRQDIK